MSTQPLHVAAERNSNEREALCRDGLMAVKEAAGFLGLSRSKLYELMDNGQLPYVKIGRSRRVPRQAVVELAARGLQGGYRST